MPPFDREHLLEDLQVFKPRNSAGRNVPVAITVGVILGAIVIGCLIVGPLAWYPFIAIVAAIATWEVTYRLKQQDWQVHTLALIAGGQLIIWLSYFCGTTGVMMGLVATMMAVLVFRLFMLGSNQVPRNWLRDASVSLFVVLWIPLCLALAGMLSTMDNPWEVAPQFVIATMILCVVGNDVGGYVAGVFFGRHPMAPAISPKKSWEGFAGSLILASAIGTAAMVFLLGGQWWVGTIFGLCLAVAATLGDLVESQFKRDLGVKDMSKLLPGHGGVMDRADGMLPAAAMTWLVLTILL